VREAVAEDAPRTVRLDTIEHSLPRRVALVAVLDERVGDPAVLLDLPRDARQVLAPASHAVIADRSQATHRLERCVGWPSALVELAETQTPAQEGHGLFDPVLNGIWIANQVLVANRKVARMPRERNRRRGAELPEVELGPVSLRIQPVEADHHVARV